MCLCSSKNPCFYKCDLTGSHSGPKLTFGQFCRGFLNVCGRDKCTAAQDSALFLPTFIYCKAVFFNSLYFAYEDYGACLCDIYPTVLAPLLLPISIFLIHGGSTERQDEGVVCVWLAHDDASKNTMNCHLWKYRVECVCVLVDCLIIYCTQSSSPLQLVMTCIPFFKCMSVCENHLKIQCLLSVYSLVS